ncbi:hypothetical protein [Nocardia tengchongensis]
MHARDVRSDRVTVPRFLGMDVNLAIELGEGPQVDAGDAVGGEVSTTTV